LETYKYRAFGLGIESELEIEFLEQNLSPSKIDLYFKNDNDISLPSEKYYKHPNFSKITSEKSLFFKKDLGIFEINKNGIIKFKDLSILPSTDLARVILGLPIGYFLHFDNLVFHGSAVCKNNEAYGFIGKSGTGKSSLALEMLENNFSFLTEDVMCIKEGKILPSLPFIKVSEFYHKKFAKFLNEKKYVFPTDHLNRYGTKINNKCFSTKEVKMKNLIILFENSKAKNLLYKEKNKFKLFQLMLENTFKPNPLYLDKIHLKRIMDSVMNIINNCEVYIADFEDSKKRIRNQKINELICK